MTSQNEYEVKLIDLKHLDENTVMAHFSKPQGFDFKPGQFVMVGFSSTPKVKKAYSIASLPEEDYIEIAARVHHPSEFSEKLAKAETGELFSLGGPYGVFTLPIPVTRNSLFVAAGCGIAPMIGMIRAGLKAGTDKKMVLIFGARHKENLVYKEEIETLAKEHDNFEYKFVLSRPGDDWKGEKGHCQDVIKKFYEDGQGWDAYMCGPPSMIDDTFNLLQELGYKPHKERWGTPGCREK